MCVCGITVLDIVVKEADMTQKLTDNDKLRSASSLSFMHRTPGGGGGEFVGMRCENTSVIHFSDIGGLMEG